MGVFRVDKTKNYTVMSNYHFRDKRLSFKAKGLLSFMLSLPDDWDYSVQGLITTAKDGRDSVTSGLKELEHYGYLKREAIREKGIIKDWNYIIYEQPEQLSCKTTGNTQLEPDTENPKVDNKPDTENPDTEKPLTENPKQINTKDNKYINNNIYNISSISEKKSSKENENEEFHNSEKEIEKNEKIDNAINEFEEIWKNYPKKVGKSKAREFYIAWTINGRKLKTNNYRLRKLTKEEVEIAIKNYNLEVTNREYQYIKNADTFFNTAILDYITLEKHNSISKNTQTQRTSSTSKNSNTYRNYSQRKYSKADLNRLYANSWLQNKL